MAYERKDYVVVATAPDGEIIAFGKMTRTDAGNLVREIERHPGWAATIPIFGTKAMWPSTLEAKGVAKEVA